MRVRIIKDHVHDGRVALVGEELELPDFRAYQKIASGKAQAVSPGVHNTLPPASEDLDSVPADIRTTTPEVQNADPKRRSKSK